MSEISLDLVLALIARSEGPLLDFKEQAPDFDSAKGKSEFAKDVLAFANSLDAGESAFVLYGVRDARRGGGVQGLHAAPTAEQVSQVLSDFTAPPPKTAFRLVDTEWGRVGVLSIVGVSARPHHATRAFEGSLNPSIVYVRRDQVNAAATSREVELMIRQSLGEGGRRIDQAPLKVGFVGRDRHSGLRTLIVRVTNTTETAVAGVEVLVDFQHMSLPGLSARRGVFTNMTLAPGESREATVEVTNLQFTVRAIDPGPPPRVQRVLAERFGTHVGDWWMDAILRVFFRDADGFLHQLTSTLALDS